MEKSTKVSLVSELKDKFARADATFIAEYKGIKAGEMTELRKTLRDSDVEFKVVRNTLARRAIEGTDVESISEHMTGANAIIFSFKDAAAAAKSVTEFAKKQPRLKLKLGTLGPKVIGIEEINDLAALPPREVLLGKLLGSMKSPTTGLVAVLSGVPRKLLYALNAISEQKAQA